MQYTVGLRRKVSLVVMMLDATRDVPVPSVRVSLDPEHNRAIIRPDGFHVFLNLPDGPVDVIADAPGYYRVRFAVDTSALRELMPVVRVRMPAIKDPSAAWVRGRVTDNAGKPIVGAHIKLREEASLKLLGDAVKGQDMISVFNPSGRYLGGMLCELRDGEKKAAAVRLLDYVSDGEYELDEPLRDTFSRSKGRLHRIHETSTDQDGRFQWPIAISESSAVTVYAMYEGFDKAVELELTVRESVDLGDVALSFLQ